MLYCFLVGAVKLLGIAGLILGAAGVLIFGASKIEDFVYARPGLDHTLDRVAGWLTPVLLIIAFIGASLTLGGCLE